MSEVSQYPKNNTKKPKRKGVPKSVMKIVEERSQGIDELYGFGSATDPHHIKHRSQGGLDIPINIIHVGRLTHNECHAKPEIIKRTWKMLNDRILELFAETDKNYGIFSHPEVIEALQIEPKVFYNELSKGNIKTYYPGVVQRNEILFWLMPKGWWVS